MKRPEIAVFVIQAVQRCSGTPLPDTTLRAAMRLGFPHLRLTEEEIGTVIRDVEVQGWITGGHDELLGLQWAITPRGELRAGQLH